MKGNRAFRTLLVLGSVGLALAQCGGTPKPQPSPRITQAAVTPTATRTLPTPTPPPPTPTPPGPKVGGTLVVALSREPDTLDVHKTTLANDVMDHVGASLVARDPATGQYVGYLADSWTTSQDGLTWTFTLKRGVKFHDGTPFTAHDFEWTIGRVSQASGDIIPMIESAEAVDDQTLRLQLRQPYFPLLYTLSLRSYAQPLPRAAVEHLGDRFGRQPVGIGPFRFKEWNTGERIVLERNADYNWRPAFIQGGPYLDFVEFRIIPEYAISLAGLETSEIDYGPLEPRDVSRLKSLAGIQVLETVQAGMSPVVHLNAGRPPFDDVRVRRAVNLAVDRQGLIQVVARDSAVEQRGPLSPSVAGYWPGVEEIGYRYDAAQAKALLKEAGYALGSDGVLEKEGRPLKVNLQVQPVEWMVKVAEVLQQQYKSVGIAIEIMTVEPGLSMINLGVGNYDMSVQSQLYGEADMLVVLFGGARIGGFNVARVEDPDLDAALAATRSALDPGKRQEAANAAQRRIVEQALLVPLYAPKRFTAVSSRVKGLVQSTVTGDLWLVGAYISAR